MNKFLRFTNINKDIEGAIKQIDYPERVNHILEFIKNKQEKITYFPDTKQYYINSFFPSFPSLAWNRLVNGFHGIIKCDDRIPIQADIAVTGRCHCNCWHCFRPKETKQDMDLALIRDLLSRLSKMGTATVGITGGEPMLHKDIVEIIKSIPDKIQAQLYTTGHSINNEFAKIIKNSNVNRCIISLDHYNDKIVNEMRHNDNAFEEVINAIKILRKYNIYIAITLCITENLLNEDDLKCYFKFATNLDINEIRVIMPIPQGKLEGKDFSHLYANAIKYVRAFKTLNALCVDSPTIVNFCEFESPAYMGCNAGANYISINNTGAVTPCVAVPLSFGNIYEQNIEDVFEKMQKYFPNSGRICYGKIANRVMCKSCIKSSDRPLPIEESLQIAEKCHVSKERAAFFVV